MRINLGVDSTDSLTEGMCTTYVGAVIAERLLGLGAVFTDYPNLIRLNPNIPYKTRGNGAVCLRCEVGEDRVDDVLGVAKKTVEELSVFDDLQANPGIALLRGEVPTLLYEFYQRALHQLLMVEEAYETAEKVGARLCGYKNKRGVIGALASIGETLKGDHTYEILTYRKEENWGKKREIDVKTVIEMDKKVSEVFFNYDYAEKTLCIAPHSVCPVLAGIRGETAQSVKEALSMVNLGEPVSKYVVFRTNQHTNFHFERVLSVSDITDYRSVIVEGEVAKNPFIIKGGHVFFELENRGRILCAAFEPTKGFRDAVRVLNVGDSVRAYGGVKPGSKGRTLNLERLDVLKVVTSVWANPKCLQCGRSMTSEGKGKGYACEKCGTKKREKECVPINRRISPGIYEPPPSAWRHLYKMTARERTNRAEKIELIEGWMGYSE